METEGYSFILDANDRHTLICSWHYFRFYIILKRIAFLDISKNYLVLKVFGATKRSPFIEFLIFPWQRKKFILAVSARWGIKTNQSRFFLLIVQTSLSVKTIFCWKAVQISSKRRKTYQTSLQTEGADSWGNPRLVGCPFLHWNF